MNSNQPREYDAVLGGQAPPPTDGAVLGGIEGIKHRLDSNDINVKINALSDAIKFGSVGLDLVIESFKKDKSEPIRKAAYLLLRNRTENRLKEILPDYDYWNLFTHLYTLEGDVDGLTCMAITPNKQTLFSGDNKGNIRVWNLNTRKLKYVQPTKSGPIISLDISSDGKSLASGSMIFNTIKIWDIEPEKLEQRCTLKDLRGGQVYSLAFSVDGQNVFSLSPYGSTMNWNLITKKGQRFEGDKWAAQCFAISRNRQFIVTGMHEVNLWDTTTGKLKKILQPSRYPVYFLSISDDEKTIVGYCENNIINVWDVDTGSILNEFNWHSAPITSLAISNDGKTLISSSYDNSIKIWDLNNLKLKKTLSENLKFLQRIVISPDEQLIISGREYDCIRVWGLSEHAF